MGEKILTYKKIPNIIHDGQHTPMAKECWENFHMHNVLLGRSNLHTVYWDIKLVNRSQPDQKALPLHFII
jgi:hypothetical protein